MIQWKTRCKKDMTAVTTRRHWESKDNTYRVTESVCLYGPKEGPQAIPTAYYAMYLNDRGWWDIISRHRKRTAATTACEQHVKAKAKTSEPRKRKRRTQKDNNPTPQKNNNPRKPTPPTTNP
jgi:hypothetical protein